MTDYSSLFKPFELGRLRLSNRIVMAPMTRNQSPDNIPNEASLEYYRRRAAGGAGLIITEGTCINHIAASGYADVPFFYGDEALASWGKIADAVHEEKGRIAPQLWHCGGMRGSGTLPAGDIRGYTPSGMNVPGKLNRYPMTKADIDEVISAYAEGARQAEALGFDAVEVHGAHGYLIDQFFWEGTNQREDGYGGSLINRTRFAREIIIAMRDAVDSDFPIIFRWSQWKSQDFSARLADTPKALAEFLEPLSEAGIDIFHCSTRRFWEAEFEGSDLNLAGWTKKITGKPAITVGSVGLSEEFIPKPGETKFRAAEPASLENLVERMEMDEFDLAAVGRALIANPDWADLVKSDNLDKIKSFNNEMLSTLF